MNWTLKPDARGKTKKFLGGEDCGIANELEIELFTKVQEYEIRINALAERFEIENEYLARHNAERCREIIAGVNVHAARLKL